MGRVLSFIIVYIRVECLKEQLNCHHYLTLTGNLLGRYCGNTIPDSIDTSSNVALVRFVTDGSLTASGFRLRFESSLEGKLSH